MKTIVMLYESPDWGDKVPFDSSIYGGKILRKGYESFARTAIKKNLLFARACYKWYVGSGIFSKAWVFDSKWKRVKNLKVDIVFDKTPSDKKFLAIKKRLKKDIRIFNDPFIDILCSDKMLTAKKYPRLMPKSIIVNNKKEWEKEIKNIKTEKVVLKPVRGSSAKDVKVTKKNRLPKKILKNTIIQEFVDGKKGIPGLTKGVSDLRLIVCDGKIISALTRNVKKGFITNISHGAKVAFLTNKKIPKKVKEMLKEIDSKLHKYKSRLYTADFIFDGDGKPWLIELNSKPGFFYFLSNERPDLALKFEDAVLNSIKRLI